MEYLLIEDECAPDAGWHFEKKLKERFGLRITEFTQKGKKVIDKSDHIAYEYNGYILESFADAPQWHLRKCV